jgi:hypothetical protein
MTPGTCLSFQGEYTTAPYFRAFSDFNGSGSHGRFGMGYTSLAPALSDANARLMPGNTVTVSGSVWAMAFNTTSDVRLKENIVDLSYGLDTVNSLRPVEFTWIGDENQQRKLGFIAQETINVVPEAVGGTADEDNYYQFDYDTIIPVNTKAIQELSAKVDNLEATVQTLLARIEALENK